MILGCLNKKDCGSVSVNRRLSPITDASNEANTRLISHFQRKSHSNWISALNVSLKVKLCSNLSLRSLTSSQHVHTASWTNRGGLWRISLQWTPWKKPGDLALYSWLSLWYLMIERSIREQGSRKWLLELKLELLKKLYKRTFGLCKVTVFSEPCGRLLTEPAFTCRKRISAFKCLV